MKNKKIKKEHGYGGAATRRLISEIIIPAVNNPAADKMDDGAEIKTESRNLVFTTDGYVVKPLFFPGGDIGKLAVSGTINDIIAQGARAEFISAGIIVEEGFLVEDFKKIIESAAAEAQQAGADIVCGDLKVVEPGSADGLFINTSGIGSKIEGIFKKPVVPGDALIITGGVGEHGAAVFQARNNILEKSEKIKSDLAALTELYKTIEKFKGEIKFMRDPTRGGVGEVMLEFSEQPGISVEIYEKDIPVKDWVKGLSYITGLDYLYLACEGRMIMACSPDSAEGIVNSLKETGFNEAAIIGSVKKGSGAVLNTLSGGRRQLTSSEIAQIPRIC